MQIKANFSAPFNPFPETILTKYVGPLLIATMISLHTFSI
jgi:hypothetical protein